MPCEHMQSRKAENNAAGAKTALNIACFHRMCQRELDGVSFLQAMCMFKTLCYNMRYFSFRFMTFNCSARGDPCQSSEP